MSFPLFGCFFCRFPVYDMNASFSFGVFLFGPGASGTLQEKAGDYSVVIHIVFNFLKRVCIRCYHVVR